MDKEKKARFEEHGKLLDTGRFVSWERMLNTAECNVSDKSKADWDRIMNTSEVGCIDEAELERLTAPIEDSMPAIYWKELGAIVAAYGAMGLFVAACFAMAGF